MELLGIYHICIQMCTISAIENPESGQLTYNHAIYRKCLQTISEIMESALKDVKHKTTGGLTLNSTKTKLLLFINCRKLETFDLPIAKDQRDPTWSHLQPDILG